MTDITPAAVATTPDTKARAREAERKKFQQHIERLDELCKTRPKVYFARLIALAALGYAYIWLVLAALAFFCFLLLLLLIKLPFLALKLGLPLLILIGVIMRSFWIKGTPPPEGVYLKKHEYRQVFEIVEEIRQAINAPRVDAIVIIPDFNAAVLQKARLGLLGWHKNYLLLGMPLMQAFPLDQLKAVLAHEMGHLAKSHSANCAWIYRVRGVWTQLMDNLSGDQSVATVLFGKFFDWYAPYFDASSFALARMQEYHADECAIQLAGRDASAAMLIGTHVKGQFIERKYWQNLWNDTKHLNTPYERPFTDITEKINGTMSLDQASTWLELGFKQKTNYLNTHPCLKERLRAILKVSDEEVESWAQSNLTNMLQVNVPASESLFGDKLPALLRELDKNWCTLVGPAWEEQHKQLEEYRKEITDLEEKCAQDGKLNDDDLVTLAAMKARVESFESAMPLFNQAFEQAPDHPLLQYTYGQWLVDEENAEGVKYLERAMELDGSLALNCCQAIYSFLHERGENEAADRFLDKAQECVGTWVLSQQERSNVFDADTYEEHDVEPEKMSKLVEYLETQGKVARAYFVRKHCKIFLEKPLYVLVIDFKFGPGGNYPPDDQVLQEIAQSGAVPGETIIIARIKAPKNLLKAMTDMGSAQILSR